jgi:hypothetical protein
MHQLLDKLPEEVSFLQDYTDYILKFARSTRQETSELFDTVASDEELEIADDLWIRICEKENLATILHFIEAHLDDFPDEARKLNAFLQEILPVRG